MANRVIVLVLACLAVALAQDQLEVSPNTHAVPFFGERTISGGSCTYLNANGEEFDLRMLEKYVQRSDWKIIEASSGSVFHFNPCGGVNAPVCPADSSLCKVTPKGEAISFGSAESALWADGVENGASIEITYGNGELCNNGLPRKTVVELRCVSGGASEEDFDEASWARTHVVGLFEDECSIKLIVESPFACPKRQMCKALDEEGCTRSEGLCAWHRGTCQPRPQSWLHKFARKHHVTAPVFFALLCLASLVLSCLFTTCVCCLCRRRKAGSSRRRNTMIKKERKAPKALKQNDAELAALEPMQAQYFFYPVQADGAALQQQASVPYAYSYPMVQVVPAFHAQHPY